LCAAFVFATTVAASASGWSRQLAVKPASKDSALTAVTCTSPRVCVAVGYFKKPGRSFALVERWNGVRWSIQPNPAGWRPSVLSGVSCTSATACTAVGSVPPFDAAGGSGLRLWSVGMVQAGRSRRPRFFRSDPSRHRSALETAEHGVRHSGVADRTHGRNAPSRIVLCVAIRCVRHDRVVPRISEFYGIVIETGEVFAGFLPGRVVRLVREWLGEHRAELVTNWDRASAQQPTEPVAPLT
jgi:Domain of unknown function (DUF4160)